MMRINGDIRNPIVLLIADIYLEIHSDCERDLEFFSKRFPYHVATSIPKDAIVHRVVIRGVDKVILPENAAFRWQSYHNAICRVNSVDRAVRHKVGCFHCEEERCDYYKLDSGQYIRNCYEERLTECLVECTLAADGKRERPLIDYMLSLLFHVLFTVYHRYTVHASCVARNGEAYLLFGASGAGKSTLCADLIVQGADYVGDDIVFLYEDADNKLMVGALLRPAKLFERNSKAKDDVDLIERYHCGYLLKAPVKTMFRVRQTHRTQSSLVPEPDVEQFAVLMRAFNSAKMQFDKDHWLSLATRFIKEVPYYCFRFGNRKYLDIKILDKA